MMKSMLKPIIAIAAAALILVGSGAALSKTAAANAEKELNEMLVTLLPGSTSFEMESLSAFMNNIKYGLFLLDDEWNILPQYSAVTPRILGCPNPEKYNFLLLMARSLSRERTMLLKDFLERLYNPEFKESVIDDMNPVKTLEGNIRTPSVKEPGKTIVVHKALHFEFKRLYNRQHTKVINILVSVQISGS